MSLLFNTLQPIPAYSGGGILAQNYPCSDSSISNCRKKFSHSDEAQILPCSSHSIHCSQEQQNDVLSLDASYCRNSQHFCQRRTSIPLPISFNTIACCEVVMFTRDELLNFEFRGRRAPVTLDGLGTSTQFSEDAMSRVTLAAKVASHWRVIAQTDSAGLC